MLEETLTSDSKSGRQDKCWGRHLPVTVSLGGRTSVGGSCVVLRCAVGLFVQPTLLHAFS